MKKITGYLLWGMGITMMLMLSGCATTQNKNENLDQTLRAYEKTIRWVAWDSLNTFRKEPVNFSIADRKRLKPIKVTGYKTLTADRNANELKLQVEIRYYHEEYARVKNIIDEQTWVYDEKSKNWFITTPLPYFR